MATGSCCVASTSSPSVWVLPAALGSLPADLAGSGLRPVPATQVRGDATVDDDPDYVFADRVGAKYHADLRVHDQPGQTRIVVTLVATRVNAVDMSAG